MTSTPLKPCPFCNAVDGMVVEIPSTGWFAWHCDGCDAHGPLCGEKDNATIEWNTRHIPAITDDDVERADDAYWLARYKVNDKGSLRAALNAYAQGRDQ